ncbi:MAG: N-acetyltransferase family protein [Candidatus Thorarchaeota archaeon]
MSERTTRGIPMKVRLATREDIPWIVHHRIEMFRSMGYSESLLTKARVGIESFMENEWDESIECYLVIIEEEIVGGCAVSVYSRLPNPRKTHAAKIACIHNVFVEPQFRNQGIATALMTEVLSHCRKKGILKATLHDTDMSSSLYRKLGFTKVKNYYELWMEPDIVKTD